MTFAFPLLLGGLLLAGIPVLLHLLMRQKPKIVLFPAFRFLVKRHRTNLTKLRLRHIFLMALRIVLVAFIVLALVQPKVENNPWSLPSDRAVAAIFIFDTSASMEYAVTANQARLKDAQKRALEMLNLLPENCEVVILDSGEATPLGKGEWLTREKAAERIGQLKLQPAGGPVSARVATALDLLARVAKSKEEAQRAGRARVLCVFSDRAVASWDAREQQNLQALANQVPPPFERLAAVQAGLAEQEKLVEELPQGLPAIAQAFPPPTFVGLLQNLKERLVQLRSEEYPDEATPPLLAAVRSKQQELLALLEQNAAAVKDANEYVVKLKAAIIASLRHSAGFLGYYVDVGVEQPRDLALTDLQLVYQSVNGGPAQFKLRLDAKATGEDARSTVTLETSGTPPQLAIEIKAGKRDFVTFDVEPVTLQPQPRQIKAIATPSDQLAINNSRYLTFAFRRVLVLTDRKNEAESQMWAAAVEAYNFNSAWYRCDIKTPAELGERTPAMFDGYAVVFLCNLNEPDDKLWTVLADYVGKGGSVGVIPGGSGMKVDSYNSKPAQEVLPATFGKVIGHKEPGADWDWSADIFKHPLLHPFQEWRRGKWDFVEYPRGAMSWWQVEPRKDNVHVLVRFAADKGPPAIVERLFDSKRGRLGRVLLFATRPGWRDWNNYDGNSFYVALAGRTIGYLSGDDDRPSLNFLCGQGVPRVPVPIAGQAMTYKLYRDGPTSPPIMLGNVTVEEGHNEARVLLATEPGNYTLHVGDAGPVCWFSVNLPPEESDLTKVGKGEIESVMGPESVVAIDRETDLGKWVLEPGQSRPLDFMPILMVLVLVLLAVENLLANKFYRREPQV